MKKFKAHSDRILQLMINSIYTNKEIFLRELISNASDAIDKAKFLSLTDENLLRDFFIRIEIDKENRALKIIDSGIGMNEAELEENLGIIAESGTEKFKTENKQELIGQFGVGFYSSFMVSKSVEIVTKKHDESGYRWVSDTKGYSIERQETEETGTKITLFLKESDEEYNYDEFLDENHISFLIKKYSDYIHYPIYIGDKVINSMTPIWKRAKTADKEELNEFYKKHYFSHEPYLDYLSFSVEGNINFDSLLFFPSSAPFDYYSSEYERGLSLYCNGVLILQNCKELIPDYLGFVRGLVECNDISLNISRELLQKTRQIDLIAKSIEKKILSFLQKMLNNEREKYERLFNSFSQSIKFGIYNNFGIKKDELKDLLLYYSSKRKSFITLKEYVEAMGENKNILYAVGADIDSISSLPVLDYLKEKDIEVLFLTDRIDEFVMRILNNYDGKPIKSVFDKEVDFSVEEKQENDEHKNLLEDIRECLKEKVKEVKLSGKLKNHPCLLSSDNEISLEMEKVLNSVNKDNKVRAEKVLEINPSHAIFKKLKSVEKSILKDISIVLYYEALMNSGLEIEEKEEYFSSLNRILAL